MKEPKQLVKLTTKGKVSITLPHRGTLKSEFWSIIEALMSEIAHSTNNALTLENASDRIKFALLSEVYVHHMMAFNLVTRQDVKLLITIPQAIAIWELSQDYSSALNPNPEMGNLLMKLHQKLC